MKSSTGVRTLTDWWPKSWQTKLYQQAIHYPTDPSSYLNQLAQSAGLVTIKDILELKTKLALAEQGEYFVLQGGDCAETFATSDPEYILAQANLLTQLRLLCHEIVGKKVVCIGRIGGQFAKPRSEEFEYQNGTKLPVYRGDLVNGADYKLSSRLPDPSRMLKAYQISQKILKLIQAKNIYTSHEALHLPYETTLVRNFDHHWYNLSAHFLWIGYRTNALEGAHIEFVRGISNPIAIKVGPGMQPKNLAAIVKLLNPNNQSGRLTLIARLGISNLEKELPALIRKVQDTGIKVLWLCDPMHGNTHYSKTGLKLRYLNEIKLELERSQQIHQAEQNYLAGIHLELTAQNVQECFDNREQNYERVYTSLVDPRLNREQAIEILKFLASKERKNDHFSKSACVSAHPLSNW